MNRFFLLIFVSNSVRNPGEMARVYCIFLKTREKDQPRMISVDFPSMQLFTLCPPNKKSLFKTAGSGGGKIRFSTINLSGRTPTGMQQYIRSRCCSIYRARSLALAQIYILGCDSFPFISLHNYSMQDFSKELRENLCFAFNLHRALRDGTSVIWDNAIFKKSFCFQG